MSPATMRRLFAVVLTFSLSACSLFNPPPFSQKEIHWADREIVFKDVEHHMKAMEGTKVILGGEILSVTYGKTTNLLIVRDFPLGPAFHPETDKPSKGAFAILTDQEVPGDRYATGRSIEVIGEIRAPIQATVDGKSQRLPLIWARNLHAQAPAPSSPDPVMEDPALIDPGAADPGYMDPGTFDPFMW